MPPFLVQYYTTRLQTESLSHNVSSHSAQYLFITHIGFYWTEDKDNHTVPWLQEEVSLLAKVISRSFNCNNSTHFSRNKSLLIEVQCATRTQLAAKCNLIHRNQRSYYKFARQPSVFDCFFNLTMTGRLWILRPCNWKLSTVILNKAIYPTHGLFWDWPHLFKSSSCLHLPEKDLWWPCERRK